MNPAKIHWDDVQGLVRFGYGSLKQARYELLKIKDVAAAKAWLKDAHITNAVKTASPPPTALNVAFTAPGLLNLGLPAAVVAQFSHEFRGGMADPNRARQLGDTGPNAPEQWLWGKPGHEPDLVVLFFAETEHFQKFVADAKGDSWDSAFELVENGVLETCPLDPFEPFGFADGISQPEIEESAVRKSGQPVLEYSNLVAPGEFLLGHPNEYGKFTDRPLLAADAASDGLFPAPEEPAKRDLGHNGTYLVIRQLEQDVRSFWQFVDRKAGGDAAKSEELAAAMVGRKRMGEPLVELSDKPIEGIKQTEKRNHFTYDNDPAGTRCPFGAHLRRANPRNADFDGKPANFLMKLATMLGFGPRGFRDDLLSSVRFHRILRRGREYGDGLAPEDALEPAPPGDPPRGIHFICVNANISRQFEFIQNAWMAGTKFSGLSGESDPLNGSREAIPGCPVTGNFTRPTAGGLPERIDGLPRFVTVRGGAYFFMPGLRALKFIAGG